MSVGSTGDIRKIFTVMLGVSNRYIATNTGEEITIKVKEDDERVLEVKGSIN